MCVFSGRADVAKQTLSISEMSSLIYKANHYIENIIKSLALAVTVPAISNFICCGYLSWSELLWRNQNSQQCIIANIFDSLFYFPFANDDDD